MDNRFRWLLIGSAATLTLAGTPAAAQQTPPAETGTADQSEVQLDPYEARGEGIIVTAQKRDQTLIEVPQSVSVVSGEVLERQQATSFIDYVQLVPGLSVTQTNPGETRLTLRGINTGSTGSTVAVYIDDAPFGASGSLSNGAVLAGDFDTFDVARVEVLRGPQGTLYGANSLGGVLKFVTQTPVLGEFQSRGQAGIETTRHGGTGYLGNLVLNAPISDSIAIRASGFYRKTAGYIDAIGRPASNVNSSKSYGGRASLLFQPTTDFSIRLGAVLQNIEVESSSTFTANPLSLRPVNPVTGLPTGKDRLRYQRFPEFHDVDYRLYSGVLDWDFGFATLTSASSYSTQKQDQFTDFSTNALNALVNAIYAPTAPNTLGFGVRAAVDVKKFTQEVRLTSKPSDIFEWLVGGYYTHEKTRLFQRYRPFNLAEQTLLPTPVVLPPAFGGVQIQEFVIASIDANYEEYAGFATGTVHIGPNFDITAGGRYSHNNQDSVQAIVQLGSGAPVSGTSSEGVFTWSVAPRYELSDTAAIYARVAKGYRPGGPNFVPPGAPADFPTEFNADTLISYEAGIKAETLDRTFGIDLSGFYVDWNDILIVTQITTTTGPATINANGRGARTYGAEATATFRPMPGLSIVVNAAYTKANLVDDTTLGTGGSNVTGGLAGDDLPYTPRVAANVSADYEWQPTTTMSAYVGGSVSLQGDQRGGFSSAYRRAFGRQIDLDGYHTVDLRAGVEIGSITVSAYARNLFDSSGLISAGGYPFSVPPGLGGLRPPPISATATTIRPRTIGATVGFSFR